MAVRTIERSASVDGERAVEGADARVLVLAGGLARRLLQPTESGIQGSGANRAMLVSAGCFSEIGSGLGFASTGLGWGLEFEN